MHWWGCAEHRQAVGQAEVAGLRVSSKRQQLLHATGMPRPPCVGQIVRSRCIPTDTYRMQAWSAQVHDRWFGWALGMILDLGAPPSPQNHQ